MIVLRTLATIVGAAILAASTWVVIDTKGLTGAHAGIVIAMAAGLAIGAVALGRARFLWKVALCLVMLAGEAFGLMVTAERVIIARDAEQVPLIEAARARTEARKRIAAAETAMGATSQSQRLTQALAAKSKAEQDARDKASDRGCASNCRIILEAAIASAGEEVDRARQELADKATAAKRELDGARDALAALPVPRSASPLADRLGVEAWLLDVVQAALLAIGANGLAVVLMAWGSHGTHAPAMRAHATASASAPAEAPASIVPEPAPAPVVAVPALPAPVVDGYADVCAFLDSRTKPADGITTPVGVLYGGYQTWAAELNLEPMSMTRFGYALSECGVEKQRQGGRIVVVGRAPAAAAA